MSTLELRQLATGYGDLRVVTDATLEVEAGSVTALLGRNGAGKTTTLRAVAGLNKITSGAATLDGTDLAALPAYRRARAGIAYVQEGKRIFRSRTVEENLRLGTYAGRSAARGRELTGQMYERFPLLAERRKLRAAQLSGGQQQMLAIAQALVADPRVLLLDEPSAGLAPAIVGQVLDVIRDLRARGLAVLLVEQAVEFALAAADRVVVLNLGRTVYSGQATDTGLREAIRRAYMAEELA
ncbi:ABC transporter ATP-binding protein [Dactylosporangium sp. AC04546]|uniref:ABC transporter ATP-binding protein n=1 Tax=Dactylosporangium sp. AC04546 TaxID=2862460 RepID=UPI001EDEB010|nr:ABC transporter ATP-binding protein [Dactylosporangium sp. AC04546]WVK78466.1 ABC transporter ATP-binding protein [Dactylosporangium sp. AC04546]